ADVRKLIACQRRSHGAATPSTSRNAVSGRPSCTCPVGGRLFAVTDAARYLAVIPSPTRFAWFIGPIPIRAYALCIILGIVAACVITEIRMRRRGAPKYFVLDLVIWAVLFGIPGGRIYHVITSPDKYFGTGGHP